MPVVDGSGLVATLNLAAYAVQQCQAFRDWVEAADQEEAAAHILLFEADIEDVPDPVCLIYHGDAWIKNREGMTGGFFLEPEFIMQFEMLADDEKSTPENLLALAESVDKIMLSLENAGIIQIQSWRPAPEDPQRANKKDSRDSVWLRVVVQASTLYGGAT